MSSSRSRGRHRAPSSSSVDRQTRSRHGDENTIIGHKHSRNRNRSENRSRGGFQGGGRGKNYNNFPEGRERNMARKDYRKKSLTVEMLQKWSTTDDCGKLIMQMSIDKDLLEVFAADDMTTSQEVELLLQSLTVALNAQHQKESIKDVLGALCNAHFFDKKLLQYLTNKRQYESSWSGAPAVFKCLLSIIEEVLNKLPNYANQCLALSSHLSVLGNFFTSLYCDIELKSSVEAIQAKSRCVEVAQREKELNNSASKYFDTSDSSLPPDDFVNLSVVPTLSDLHKDSKPFLRRAVVQGVYEDVPHYLDVQFRLMKQDFVLPLRLGINEFIQKGCPEAFWASEIRIYTNVHVEKMLHKDAIDHVLRFDVSRLKNVKWDVSKRLIFGSLLCLSKDNFRNVVFATVANRDVRGLAKGFITINVKSGLDIFFNSSASDTYVMVETTAYFESYQHVLRGLQEMSSNLPLQDYIIKCQKDIRPPKYLLITGQVPTYDLSCLMFFGLTTYVPILTTAKWPPAEDMCLNESQRQAAQLALTKELALIQGPPGTGKTYVGLKVMEVILNNKASRSKERTFDPILVVCYTNHALDQFLEGVLKFCPAGIIRVGGKSSSEILEKFNLKNLKQNYRKERENNREVRVLKAICLKSLKQHTRFIFNTSKSINNLDIEILGEDILQPYMSLSHYQSLCQHPTLDTKRSSMRLWLNVSDEEVEKIVPAMIKKHMINLVLKWGYQEYVELTDKLDIAQRASLYTHLLIAYRNALYGEVQYLSQFSGDFYVQGQIANVERLFHQSFITILPDQMLLWVLQGQFMDRFIKQVEAILPKSAATEHNDRLVECWLLGLYNNLHQQLDDVQLLGNILTGQDVRIDEFDDAEATKEAQDARIIDDGDDDVSIDEEEEGELALAAKSFSKMNFAKDSLASVMQRMDMLGIQEEVNDDSEKDEWTMVKSKKTLTSQKIRHKLLTVQPMTEDDVALVGDVWVLDSKERFSLYKYWTLKYKKILSNKMESHVQDYTKEYEKKQELNREETLNLLRKATVIGMTTTGAAKHRAVLQALGCRIIVVEEAAEVLESHIITALNKNCNHLILIGDHQQLRPNPTVYELAIHYGLEISLFERLIKNHVPHVLLKEQHRMRPEISKIMRHIYKDLEDHESVSRYENIRGVSKNIFFINHSKLESNVNDTKSKANKHEARYVTDLCKYFILIGYDPSQITILATYTGQVFAIKKTMAETNFTHRVRVTAVDNYQGEENDIIILSLVRSNLENNVGFLKVDNRVCVALSRAKKGLFVIGNFDLLASKSQLWRNIVDTAKEEKIIGIGLPVCCSNHPDFKEVIITPEDFSKCPEGGCGQPCDGQLSCGHVCPRKCHMADNEHLELKCMKHCIKKCPAGHQCLKKCSQVCGDCKELVTKKIPGCLHDDKVPCYLPEAQAICSQKCLSLLSCGHLCPGRCGDCRKSSNHVQCTELIPFSWPCGHISEVQCSQVNADKPCPKKCGTLLDCGHLCRGTCSDCLGGAVHLACQEKCDKKLPCGHKCTGYCGTQCLPCTVKCYGQCRHGQCGQAENSGKGRPSHLCGHPCSPCSQPCKYFCSHMQCSKTCSQNCSIPSCNERCYKNVHQCKEGKKCQNKLHSCTHSCSGLCGEQCVCAVCEPICDLPEEEKEAEKHDINDSETSIDDNTNAENATQENGKLKKEKKTTSKQQSVPLIKLPCGHIFKVANFDQFINKFDPDGCEVLQCPRCHKPISDCKRYERVIKERKVRREAQKIKLWEAANVTKEEIVKLCLSEKQLGDTPFLHGFRGRDIEHLKTKPEVKAVSFLFKCAFVLYTLFTCGQCGNTGLAEKIQPMKNALLKIKKILTAQQKKEVTAELLKLLHASLLDRLEHLNEIYELWDTTQLEEMRSILGHRNNEKMHRADEITLLHFFASFDHAVKEMKMAEQVLLSEDDQMLCDVINPPSRHVGLMSNVWEPLVTSETKEHNESSDEIEENDILGFSLDDKSDAGDTTERISKRLSHIPMNHIQLSTSQLSCLPRLEEWGQKRQHKLPTPRRQQQNFPPSLSSRKK